MKYKLSFLTSEKILELSNGEVRVSDTFNYRYKTPKAVLGGLFCEKIFGPIENYRCQCGQIIGKQYNGNICRVCGVEIGPSTLRYKKMGHIEFPFHVIHPLARKGIFKIFGKHEDLITGKLGIIKIKSEKGNFIDSKGRIVCLEYIPAFESDNNKKVRLLPETILDIDFIKSQEINKNIRRIISNNINPHEYVLKCLPVIPPGYRPLIEIKDTQIMDEINIHYQKIIKRKIYLQNLQKKPIPKTIILWSRHLLQKAIDGLMIYGDTNLGKKIRPVLTKITGKEGRLRGNLLGKRTDYSGRSIAVVDPSLSCDTAGIPIKMAYELFRPFIIGKIYREKKNYHRAKHLYNIKSKKAFNYLKEVVKEHRILINRQPTLHKYGLVAFKIKLHDGHTIKMPPPVFGGFNLDVDGDQMAVYLPLFNDALRECKESMMVNNNIIGSCNSQPILSLTHEIIIGLYVITKIKKVSTPKYATSYKEAEYLYQSENIYINEEIVYKNKSTCFGRILLSDLLGFEITEEITKNSIRKITNRCFDLYSRDKVLKILDRLKEIGFEQATLYGLSVGMNDIKIPSTKYEKFAEVEKYCESIKNEKSNEKQVRLWYDTIRDLKDVALEELGENNPLKIMLDTGARVKANQIVQLVVAKGLISNWKGEILEPIKNSFIEGLSPIEFFIQVYGSRKSMADKKFITPLSGYLARRLVTAARDLYIVKKDCKTTKTIKINGVERRSPITCEAKGGICQKCYGIDPATRKRIKNGIPIGVIASQSISEISTQLSMATFHNCLKDNVEILDVNNNSIKIKDLYDRFNKGQSTYTFSCSPEGKIEVSKIVGVYTNRKDNRMIRITLDNDKYFECTIDHPIMMRDGSYKEAKDIKENDSIMSIHISTGNRQRHSIETMLKYSPNYLDHLMNNHKVKKIEIIKLYKEEAFYDVTVDSKHHNFSLAVGCFVHNSGAAVIKSSPLNVKSTIDGLCSITALNENITNIIVINDKEKREYLINTNYSCLGVKEKQEIKRGEVLATYYQNVGQEDISGKIGVVEHYYEMQSKLPKSIISLESGIIQLKVNEIDSNFIDIFINDKLQGSLDKYALHYGSYDYVEKGTMLSYGEIHLKEVYKKLGLEITANLFVSRLFELYKEEGAVIAPIHFEIIFRAMTEIVIDKNNNLNVRRNCKNEDIKNILCKGITQIGKIYPSWLKKIGFGWVKKCLEDCSIKEQISMDLPSERIITGELLKHDTNIQW